MFYNKYNVEFNCFFQEVKILRGYKFIKKKEKEKLQSFLRRGQGGRKNPCGYHY